jgi:hypothetical protein
MHLKRLQHPVDELSRNVDKGEGKRHAIYQNPKKMSHAEEAGEAEKNRSSSAPSASSA